MVKNKKSVLSVSTAHLSYATQLWMARVSRNLERNIAASRNGYFMSSDCLKVDQPNIPPDLHLCLAMAQQNDFDFVQFDKDAEIHKGLLSYDAQHADLNTQGLNPDSPANLARLSERILWVDRVTGNMFHVTGIHPDRIKTLSLVMEANEPTLEEGDYKISGDCWFTVGNASIWISAPEDEETLHIKVMPKGFENSDADLAEIELTHKEISSEIERLSSEQDHDQVPEV